MVKQEQNTTIKNNNNKALASTKDRKRGEFCFTLKILPAGKKKKKNCEKGSSQSHTGLGDVGYKSSPIN